MKTKILTLIVASILLSITGFAQFNKLNNIKDKAENTKNTIKNGGNTITNGGNTVPTTEESDARLRINDCNDKIGYLNTTLEAIETQINENDLTNTSFRIGKAHDFIDQLEEESCKNDISQQKSKLAELEKTYLEIEANNNIYQENMDVDLQYVKQCVWDLDPLEMQLDVGYIGMFKNLYDAELFYTNSKNINYINNVPDMITISNKYPDEFHPDYEMAGYLEDYTINFPKYLEEQLDYLKSEINIAMVESNKTKARHVDLLENAMDMAYSAVLTADGCMILYPDNKEIAKLRETAFANYQTIAKEFAATTYTSDVHAQNAGKIVFSTSPIEIGSENAASFKTSFANNETVYAMMYLTSTLSAIQGTGFISTRIYANGTQIAEHEWKASSESAKNTFNEAEIMPTPANAETYGALKFYEAFSTTLLPGENTIKVCLLNANDNIVAEGEFTLDCSNGTEDITKRYKELKTIRLEKVRMPQAKINNPSLEASMVAAMSAQNWSETAVRAVITGDNWITHRGAVGEILFREMYAAVAFKTPEGTCKVFYMSFKQAYNGSSYGITKYYSVGGSEDINCENVYK